MKKRNLGFSLFIKKCPENAEIYDKLLRKAYYYFDEHVLSVTGEKFKSDNYYLLSFPLNFFTKYSVENDDANRVIFTFIPDQKYFSPFDGSEKTPLILIAPTGCVDGYRLSTPEGLMSYERICFIPSKE